MEFTFYDFLKGHMTSKEGVLIHNTKLDEKFTIVKKLLWVKYKIIVEFELKTHTTSSYAHQYTEQILLHESFQPIITIPQNSSIKMYEATSLLKDYLRYVSVSIKNLSDGITASTSAFLDNDFTVPYRIKDITYETLLAARKSQLQLEWEGNTLFSKKEEKKSWYQFW